MPGIAPHLYFGKRTLEKLFNKEVWFQNIGNYMAGNILPDFARNKSSVHHYPKTSNTFLVPDLDGAKHRYSRIGSSYLRYGVLAHLYLDKRFTEDFLKPRFDFSNTAQGGVITHHKTGKQWTIEEFFSPDGLYHAYSEMDRLMFTPQHRL